MPDSLPPLPPDVELETPAVLRQLVEAHRRLAELKGLAATIPNQHILINTLALQEARDSSAIENIVTTQDDLFREDSFPDQEIDAAAKEVADYARALRAGFELVRQSGLLTSNHILTIQEHLEKNRAGFRRLPGTALKNGAGTTVYTPPQNPDVIRKLMANLDTFINDPEMLRADPLIKMAILHYQFESIHPFYDGNGRTGRILNVLYLIQQGLLDIPVLYLSRYIIQHKERYYRLLQAVRDEAAWEPWILYMLSAVEETAIGTLGLVTSIRATMQDLKLRIRDAHPKIYSQDLLNNLFAHPYTRIEFVQNDLGVSRPTATKYLDTLTEDGILRKERHGRSNYYINLALYDLLAQEELT